MFHHHEDTDTVLTYGSCFSIKSASRADVCLEHILLAYATRLCFVVHGVDEGSPFYDSVRLLICCMNQTYEAVKLYTQDLGIMIYLDTYT